MTFDFTVSIIYLAAIQLRGNISTGTHVSNDNESMTLMQEVRHGSDDGDGNIDVVYEQMPIIIKILNVLVQVSEWCMVYHDTVAKDRRCRCEMPRILH